ncbi:hypothetical protein [Vibrio phage vB_VhaS-a]|nr:hypothetical protein [Vibrio phage vB_VhaS-a]
MVLTRVFEEQRAFSLQAFEGQTPLGVFRHLEKEIDELLADPQDLNEWADCFILSMDGVMRSKPTVASPEWCALRTQEAIREKSKLVTRIRDIDAFKRHVNDVPTIDTDSPHMWTYLIAMIVNAASVAGISAHTLLKAVNDKIVINKSRKWGKVDPANPDQPIHHIK